jgi:hypothetical protein
MPGDERLNPTEPRVLGCGIDEEQFEDLANDAVFFEPPCSWLADNFSVVNSNVPRLLNIVHTAHRVIGATPLQVLWFAMCTICLWLERIWPLCVALLFQSRKICIISVKRKE